MEKERKKKRKKERKKEGKLKIDEGKKEERKGQIFLLHKIRVFFS